MLQRSGAELGWTKFAVSQSCLQLLERLFGCQLLTWSAIKLHPLETNHPWWPSGWISISPSISAWWNTVPQVRTLSYRVSCRVLQYFWACRMDIHLSLSVIPQAWFRAVEWPNDIFWCILLKVQLCLPSVRVLAYCHILVGQDLYHLCQLCQS